MWGGANKSSAAPPDLGRGGRIDIRRTLPRRAIPLVMVGAVVVVVVVVVVRC